MRIIDKRTVRVPEFRRESVTETTPYGNRFSVRSVPDGQSDITYVVELDDGRVITLAIKASKNRSGMSVDGPLRVRVLKRVKVTT